MPLTAPKLPVCVSVATLIPGRHSAGVSDTAVDQQRPRQRSWQMPRSLVPFVFSIRPLRAAPTGRPARSCLHQERFGKAQINVRHLGLVTTLSKCSCSVSPYALELNPLGAGVLAFPSRAPACLLDCNPPQISREPSNISMLFDDCPWPQTRHRDRFCQSLTVLIAKLMINCQGRLVPMAGLPQDHR